MINPKTLLPMVKRLLPNESDADIMAGIQEFAKENPDATNAEALQALISFLQEMQGGEGAPQQAPSAPAEQTPSGPPFEGLMGQLGSK